MNKRPVKELVSEAIDEGEDDDLDIKAPIDVKSTMLVCKQCTMWPFSYTIPLSYYGGGHPISY